MLVAPRPRRRRRRPLLGGLVVATLAALLSGLPLASADATTTRADVVVTARTEPAEVADVGGASRLVVEVQNLGALTRRSVTLAFTLPTGVRFATDGFQIPPSWTCDLQQRMTCTRPALAGSDWPDLFDLPITVPPGQVGDVLTLRATATAGPESSTANNTAAANIRYVPGTVDLAFLSAPPAESMIAGEVTALVLHVSNTGTLPSGELTVVVPLPAGLTRHSEGGDGWDCTFGDDGAHGGPGWRCTHGPVPAGGTTAPGTVSAVVSGEPGQVLTLTGTASTTTPETTLENNTVQASVTVLQAATIRGTVWVDSDRDGVRDPAEPGAPPAPTWPDEQTGGITRIDAKPQADGQPGGIVAINADGTYLARVRPGTNRIEFYVQRPYRFTDSADSALVYYTNNTGGDTYYGYSGWVTLAGGEQAIIDAAVCYCY